MALLGTLNAGFPWGLLVVADEQSDLKLPPFADREIRYSAGVDVVMFRVMHDANGPAEVRVWDGAAGLPAADGVEQVTIPAIDVPSGRLIVGDAEREQIATIDLTPGVHRLTIFANRLVEPDLIDLVVTPNGPSA